MALSWPLSRAQLFDLLPVKSVRFRLPGALSTSRTGGGEIIVHGLGARLWQGEIALDMADHANWASIDARLALLEEPGASFLLCDPRLTGPISDPGGAILGAAQPKIAALNANNRELTLKNLPADYLVSQGDVLGFSYGTNPTRLAYHRVVTGGVAGGGGTTPSIEVTPFLRPGAAVDAAVSLVQPTLKAVLVKADYGASRATLSEGGTISWMQTLR